MATASANGIDIEYETFGDPGDPAMLLIMGLGGQLIVWDEELCRYFAIPTALLPEVRPSQADFGTTAGLDILPDGLPPQKTGGKAGGHSRSSV